jgi:hypothetical protein
MRRIGLGLALAVSACGRIAFDALPSDSAGSSSPDVAIPFCTGSASACPVGATLCDDFESSSGVTFPGWIVGLRNWAGGALDPATQVSTSPVACRGSVAAHGHTLGGAQIASLFRTVAPRPNPMYTRMWFRIASTSSALDYELLGFQDGGSNFINIDINRGTSVLTVDAAGVPPPLQGMQAPVQIAADQWTCLETRILFDPAAGELSVSVDGTTRIDVSGVATEGGTTFDHLLVGVITSLNEPATFDVDYDEIVVSGAPIGCQ